MLSSALQEDGKVRTGIGIEEGAQRGGRRTHAGLAFAEAVCAGGDDAIDDDEDDELDDERGEENDLWRPDAERSASPTKVCRRSRDSERHCPALAQCARRVAAAAVLALAIVPLLVLAVVPVLAMILLEVSSRRPSHRVCC